jgi:hypothetical protein
MKLAKESFLALAALGWVDGSLQRTEAAGLLRAAKESGLGEADVAEVERATKQKLALDGLEALRKRAAVVANDIACVPEGRPDRFDFDKLANRLKERLPQVAAP